MVLIIPNAVNVIIIIRKFVKLGFYNKIACECKGQSDEADGKKIVFVEKKKTDHKADNFRNYPGDSRVNSPGYRFQALFERQSSYFPC